MSDEVLDVPTTLRNAQRALRAEDPQVVASAESVVSYLVLHLKHRKAPVPSRLRTHLELVEAHARNL